MDHAALIKNWLHYRKLFEQTIVGSRPPDSYREFLKVADEVFKAYQDEFERNEQYIVQMAGISVAALGGTKNSAVRGEYGWSVPYQDVLNLRKELEILKYGHPVSGPYELHIGDKSNG